MITLAKSKEHPIDTIIVWMFLRCARNQEESIVYKFYSAFVLDEEAVVSKY